MARIEWNVFRPIILRDILRLIDKLLTRRQLISADGSPPAERRAARRKSGGISAEAAATTRRSNSFCRARTAATGQRFSFGLISQSAAGQSSNELMEGPKKKWSLLKTISKISSLAPVAFLN